MAKVRVAVNIYLDMLPKEEVNKQALLNLEEAQKGWSDYAEKFPEEMKQPYTKIQHEKHLGLLEKFRKVIG